MFELDENSEDENITMMLDEFHIEDADRGDLVPLLKSLADGSKVEFEATICAFVALYVVHEMSNWRTFVTLDNLNKFVCDSVLIMCSEAAHLSTQDWVGYDMLSNFATFLGEQFIEIFDA